MKPSDMPQRGKPVDPTQVDTGAPGKPPVDQETPAVPEDVLEPPVPGQRPTPVPSDLPPAEEEERPVPEYVARGNSGSTPAQPVRPLPGPGRSKRPMPPRSRAINAGRVTRG